MSLRENCRSGRANQDHEDLDHEDEERMKMTRGAYLLLSLKHNILNQEEARELEDMKCQILSPLGLYSHAGSKRKALKIREPEAPRAQKSFTNGPTAQGRSLPGELQAEKSWFYGNYAPPHIPPVPSVQHLIQKHLCSKPFEKQLTSSDVRDDQSRLSMNKEDVENHIFPLLKKGEEPSEGIHVTTYDMDGKEYPMVFKTWVSKIHVLTGGWKSFCHDSGLVQKQDFVTLWAFRNVENGNLCFVINSRRLPVFETIKRRRIVTQN